MILKRPAKHMVTEICRIYTMLRDDLTLFRQGRNGFED